MVTISRAFRRILENGNGFTIKALFLDDASKPPTSNTTHTSLKFFQEQHKYVVEELKFQVEEAESTLSSERAKDTRERDTASETERKVTGDGEEVSESERERRESESVVEDALR